MDINNMMPGINPLDANQVPIIGQPPKAIICMVCEALQILEPCKPDQKQFTIVAETLCPECKNRIRRLLYPERFVEAEDPSKVINVADRLKNKNNGNDNTES